MANAPDWTCAAYDAHIADLKLVGDLWDGVKAMRKNSTDYVPRHEKESTPDYYRRVQLARLFPGLRRAVTGVSEKPFEKNTSVVDQDKFGPNLSETLKDPCRDKRTLTAFARDLFQTAARDGVAHIFVDYPRLTAADGTEPTLADALAQRAYPYFSIITARDLLRWSTDSIGRLTMIAFRESSSEITADGEVHVTRIRVVESGQQTVYTLRQGNGNKAEWDSGVTTFVSYPGVPLVTLYFQKDGPLTATPPFLHLAHTNATHFALDSDYRNALRFAMCGVLFFSGMGKEQVEECLSVGPTAVYFTSNDAAKAGYVEQKGDALGLAVSELKKLEMEMDAESGRPFQERVGEETATGRKIDDKRGASLVHQWITSTEDAIWSAFQTASALVREPLPPGGRVTIWSDFSATSSTPATVDQLLKARASGDITRKTLLQEMRRRAVLDEEFDVESEIATLEDEEARQAELAATPVMESDETDA